MSKYGYQGKGDKLMPYYPNYSNYNPYLQQNSYPTYQGQQQIPSMMQTQIQMQQQMLPGKMVDGIDNVRATDTMMDGTTMYFPSTDGQAIYTKQLQADGRSRIITYKPIFDDNQTNTQPRAENALNEQIQGLNSLISALNTDLTEKLNSIEEKIGGYYEQSNTVGQSIPKSTRVSKSSKAES